MSGFPIETAGKDRGMILLLFPAFSAFPESWWVGKWGHTEESWIIRTPTAVGGKQLYITMDIKPTRWAHLPGNETEIDRLKIALADAIRRPMGIVPESAEGLIDDHDLKLAEERRVKKSP